MKHGFATASAALAKCESFQLHQIGNSQRRDWSLMGFWASRESKTPVNNEGTTQAPDDSSLTNADLMQRNSREPGRWRARDPKRGAARVICIVVIALALVAFAWRAFLPFESAASMGVATYTAEELGIPVAIEGDHDADGVPNGADIVAGARAYAATRPSYASAYYEGGWPTDGKGVCTDLVARALLAAGWDLRELISEDRAERPGAYDANEEPDANIDFRRVRNVATYLSYAAESLTCDTSDDADWGQWQAGDVVVWSEHVGIVSDARTADGRPYVLHHESPWQICYEEDILAARGAVAGHYRMR